MIIKYGEKISNYFHFRAIILLNIIKKLTDVQKPNLYHQHQMEVNGREKKRKEKEEDYSVKAAKSNVPIILGIYFSL